MSNLSFKVASIPFLSEDGRWTISFSLFGFGLFLAWQWMCLSTAIVFPLVSTDGLIFTNISRLVAMLVQLIALLIFDRALKFTDGRGIPGRILLYIGAVSGLAGVGFLFASKLFAETLFIAFASVGWVMCGITAAICTFLWLRIFSVINPQELCLYLSGSIILGVCIVYILCYLPSMATTIITALLPAGSLCLSSQARKYVCYKDRIKKQSAMFQKKSKMPKPVIRLLSGIFFYTLIYAALINPLTTRSGIGLESSGNFMLLPSLLAGVVIIAITWFSSRIENLRKLYMIILPLLVVTLVVFPFVRNVSISVAGFIGTLSFQLFDIICWVIMSDSAFQNQTPTTRVLIHGRLAYFAAMLLGSAIGYYLAINDLFKDKDLFTQLCLGGVVILVIVTTIVLKESELFSSSSNNSNEIQPEADAEDNPAAVIPKAEEVFQYKAQLIAQRYNLTQREFDVFLLLSKGRSNKLIEERLYISSHTVDSHVTHIYRKCGVHSRQEIMDLIEQEHVDMQALGKELLKNKQEQESIAE